MDNNTVNRSDNHYTSLLHVDETIFPVTWIHMDDDTPCTHPEVCARDTYVRGGRPGFGSNLTV